MSTVIKPYYFENLIDIQQQLNTSKNSGLDNDSTVSGPRRNPFRARIPTLRARNTQQSKNKSINGVFATRYEAQDLESSKRLRAYNVICTPGATFQTSRQQKIDGLIAKGVFEFILYEPETIKYVRLFKSRLVDEIKGEGIDMLYEKLRLVIQA